MRSHSSQIPLVQALSWIVGITLLFAIVAHRSIRYVFFHKKSVQVEANVDSIVQTGSCKEALHSDYLMELLDLSVDHSVSFSRFDVELAQKKILSSPVIKQAEVKKRTPGTIYIDYTVRRPIAWLADFCNTGLDCEGVLFPVHPFFSPKRIPEIYLGAKGYAENNPPLFGKPLTGKFLEAAFTLLEILSERGKDLFFIKRIDVSKMQEPSLGKREIVVVLEQEIYTSGRDKPSLSLHFLRLSARNFSKEIANYLNLRSVLLETEKQEVALMGKELPARSRVIDLRLEQLAFVQ